MTIYRKLLFFWILIAITLSGCLFDTGFFENILDHMIFLKSRAGDF